MGDHQALIAANYRWLQSKASQTGPVVAMATYLIESSVLKYVWIDNKNTPSLSASLYFIKKNTPGCRESSLTFEFTNQVQIVSSYEAGHSSNYSLLLYS